MASSVQGNRNKVRPRKLPSFVGRTDLHKKRTGLKNKASIDEFVTAYIKQANRKPTDAYGEIDFRNGGANTAKYVKVSQDTRVEVIYQLMTKHWKLKTPNLVISVTGGARNFSLRTRLKEVFRRSLIKASENTGAWITTGGTRTGVMKHVGKAVQQYAAIKDDGKQVVTIGIVPWGVLYKRHLLRNHQVGGSSSLSLPKVYDAEEGMQGGGALLDLNHSHFILVDNGKEDNNRGNLGEIYGSEIDLRTNLEGHIGNQLTPDHVKVMIVCVIVQGGPGSLKTVYGSIKNQTPVVIVAGSGGWADVLANAYSLDPKAVNEDSITEMINESGMEPDDEHIAEWTLMVKECLSQKNLLTVFDLDPTDLSRDLDIAILEALLKVNTGAELQSHQQLKLAIAWNRSDIAQSHILNDDACIGKKDIAALFFEVLKTNKHEFCKVFLNYGVDLKEYFTVGELKLLYESATKDLIFYKKITKKGFTPAKIGELLLEYLGHSYINVYKKRFKSKKYCAIDSHTDVDKETWLQDPWDLGCKIDDPYREIFQWAILFNYREIAKYVWEYMFGSVQAAIMASRMLKQLASGMNSDQEKKNLMLSDADEYERLAAGVFAKCFLENPSKSYDLLVARLPKWGCYTCLHVAIEANDKLFVSSPGVQNFFDRVWMSNLSHNNSFLIVLSGLCPILIPVAIKFEEKEEEEEGETTGANVMANRSKKSSGRENDAVAPELEGMELQPVPRRDDEEFNVGFNKPELDISEQQSYSLFQKIIIFYDAPVTTFWLNVVFFVVYLSLFAYIILSAFSISEVFVTWWEYLLLGWTSTFLVEEFRELTNQEARFIKQKIWLHISDSWNVMDLISLSLFYIGFGLRYYVQFLDVSLTLYSLAFLVQGIRLVHIFAVHPVLGPKIIMVGKMLKDLLFFLFILIVFLLAFGVASQAILYPGETSFTQILVGIIYRPYWQIYGELFLDEINYSPNGEFVCSDTDASLPRCPRVSAIVPVIAAVYLLIANVLLLNLLIAMFSYTFDKVENQSNQIWMFQRYRLITDYYFRPPLVPPFIALSHLYIFLAYLYRKISRRLERDDPFRRTLKITLDEDEWKSLRQWEHWHAEAFVQEERQGDESKVDRQILKLSQRIDSVSTTMEDIQDRIRGQSYQHKKIKNLNEVVQRLDRMIQSLQGKAPQSAPPKAAIEPVVKPTTVAPVSSRPPSRPKTAKDGGIDFPVHVKARTTRYPNSTVKRLHVPDDKVMWKVKWDDYKPPSFTHIDVIGKPAWADEDLESNYDAETRPQLPYNNYDTTHKVQRRSHTGTYLVVEGIPRNPRGRTGLKGRGLLGRYGPNHAADPVVTRWQRNSKGKIVHINGKPVLEFVAIVREDDGELAIPGGMVDPGEQVSQTLKREFGEETLSLLGVDDVKRANISSLFKSGGLELFRGYCDDHRNTDYAWIETVACNFHDEVGDPQEGEARSVSWVKVDHTLKLFASHFDYLKKAAEMHNAYF